MKGKGISFEFHGFTRGNILCFADYHINMHPRSNIIIIACLNFPESHERCITIAKRSVEDGSKYHHMYIINYHYQRYFMCVFILMQRKDSEKRFHTAGARIIRSSKLPHDFFRPTKSQQKGTHFYRHASHPHRVLSVNARICSTVDPLLVTFNRSASHSKLEHPLHCSLGEGEGVKGAHKGRAMLPRLSLEKQNNMIREQREVKLVKIRHKKMTGSGWTNGRQVLKL